MNIQQILEKYNIAGYVTEVLVFENDDEKKQSSLSFYADGFPGVMFQQSANRAFLNPGHKQLSTFFLYGQTIKPVAISVEGAYRFIVFQLYPFATKILFGLNPIEIKDDCYDLISAERPEIKKEIQKLFNTSILSEQIEFIAAYLSKIADYNLVDNGNKIGEAVQTIIQHKGNISVKSLTGILHITERTLQRQFEEFIGISPKQFAKIIQFNSSKVQISNEAFSTLSDVVFENGYADQSHFIRNFKSFTGIKPSQFKHGHK